MRSSPVSIFFYEVKKRWRRGGEKSNLSETAHHKRYTRKENAGDITFFSRAFCAFFILHNLWGGEKMDEKTANIKNNLDNQIHKIFRNTREGSFRTRDRYKKGCHRFTKFLAEEFCLQKFQNVKAKHIYAYVEHMKKENYSPATMRNELSAIRFAYERGGGKNILPDNSKLNLPARNIGTVDKAWTKKEIEGAKHVALEGGRRDVYHAISISSLFGLRIEGVCKMTVTDIEKALEFGELYTKEKGGLERYIPVTSTEQKQALREVLSYAKEKGRSGGDTAIADNMKYGVQKQIKSIQNWVGNHQMKFRDDSLRGQENTEKLREKAEANGYKLRGARLNFHGLRYHYAQNRYEEMRKKGYSDYEAKLITSKNLGHHRPEITDVYLAEK